MNRTLIGALLAAACAATTAWGQTIGKPAPDVKFSAESSNTNSRDDWFLVGQHRGHLVVMYFWRTTNRDSVNTLDRMVKLQGTYRPRGVRFIDFVPEKQEDVDKAVSDRGLTLLQNHIYDTGVKLLQEMYGALSEPYVVIVDPRGIIRWRGHPDDALERRLDFFLKRYPPPAADDALLSQMLDNAEALISTGEPGKAWTLAHDVETITEDGDNGTIYSRATSVKGSAETKADAWLDQALELEKERKYEEAARIVAEISVRFDPGDELPEDDNSNSNNNDDDRLQVKKDADQEIGRMNGIRELKEAIREALKNARAQVDLDEARALEATGDYETALRLYESVQEKYEDTDSEKVARDAIKRIERDPEAQRTIAANRDTRMGDQLFALAEHYQHLEMYPEARETFEKLMAEHGDHELVDWAREKLSALPTATAKR